MLATDRPPTSFRRWACCVLFGVVLAGVGPVSAEVLTTTDFESGNFSGWTTFSTSNGTLGGKGFPSVAGCDHADRVSSSTCLQIQVGQLRYAPAHDVQQGGGIELTTMTGSGVIQLSARVSVTYESPTKKRNLHGGLFEWIVDGQVISTLDVGPIENADHVHHHFTGKASVTAGPHTLQLRATRPFLSGTGQPAPVQIVDDVMMAFIPQP